MQDRNVAARLMSTNSSKIVLRIAAIFMFLIIALTFSQVVSRYLFNHAFAWMEEVSRYLFLWIVTLGTAISFHRGEHMNIDAVVWGMSDTGRRYVETLRTALSMMAAGLLTYSGVLVAWRNRGSSFFSLPGFPAVVAYLSVPIAGLLILWFLGSRIAPTLFPTRR